MTQPICRDSSTSKSPVEAHTPRSREDRNQDTALYHANLLQHRKDTDLRILESLEMLLDLPSSANSDAAQPSVEDVHALKEALRSFQPSDYDSLIEERNINRLCGYALCPRPNKLQSTSAKRVIVLDKGKIWDHLKVVDKKELEHWCSDDCGLRALYLKVQLNEEPAWERARRPGRDITLFDEKEVYRFAEPTGTRLAGKLDNVSIRNGEYELVSAMQELAIERGDSKIRNNSSVLVDVNVMEKGNLRDKAQLLPESGPNSTASHDSIEGYRPCGTGRGARSTSSAEDNSDDDEDELFLGNATQSRKVQTGKQVFGAFSERQYLMECSSIKKS